MLNFNTLNTGFRELMDTDYGGFKGFSSTIPKVAHDWASVFERFYLEMILPVPGIANPNLYPSLKIFESGLLGAIQSQTVTVQLETLITTLHLGVCNGVTMLGVYATTPPPSPLILRDCFSTSFKAIQVAQMMANKIMIYVSPTFSTMVAPPFTVIKWM